MIKQRNCKVKFIVGIVNSFVESSGRSNLCYMALLLLLGLWVYFLFDELRKILFLFYQYPTCFYNIILCESYSIFIFTHLYLFVLVKRVIWFSYHIIIHWSCSISIFLILCSIMCDYYYSMHDLHRFLWRYFQDLLLKF